MTVIVPNYNGGELAVKCVRSLLNTDYHSLKIFLVDNCSTDNSRSEIAGRFGKDTRLEILALDRNYRFTGAVSIAFKHIQSEYVVLMNNDTIADPGWLTELVRAYTSSPRVGAVQAKLIRIDDPEILQYGGGMMNRLGYTMGRGVGRPERLYNSQDRIFFAAGACMLTSRRILNEVGLPDTTFLMVDDADLSWRIRLCGYEVLFVPNARVMHRGSMTLTRNEFTETALSQLVYEHFAMIMKNYSARMIAVVLPQLLCIHWLRILSLLARRKLHLACASVAGIIRVLRLLPTVWEKRVFVQRQVRKVSDSHIVSLMEQLNPEPYVVGKLRIGLLEIDAICYRGRLTFRVGSVRRRPPTCT